MSALQRAGGSTSLKLLIAVALLALLGGAGTFALSQATTVNKAGASGAANSQQNFKNHSLYAPTNVAAAGAGNTMPLTWTDAPGTSGDLHGNGNGYAIKAYHYGAASGTCSTTVSDYSTFVASTASTGTSYTDSTSDFGGGGSATYHGSFSCYLVQTWYVLGNPSTGANWTSATVPQWTSTTASVTTTAIEDGFAATSATFTNAGVLGTVATGDSLVINYDQATNAPDLTTLNICFGHTNPRVIYVGTTATGSCDTTGKGSVGSFTGGTMNNTNKDGSLAITCPAPGTGAACWTNGNKTLTIVLGVKVAGNAPTGMSSGNWTFTPDTVPEAGQVIVTSNANPVTPCTIDSTVVEGIPATSQTNICDPLASGSF